MTNYRDDIVACLERAIRRDLEKGGDGWRSTSEVAEWLGVKTAAARRELEKMSTEGLVWRDGPVEGLGAVLWWHLVAPDDDDGEGELIPVNDNEPIVLGKAA